MVESFCNCSSRVGEVLKFEIQIPASAAARSTNRPLWLNKTSLLANWDSRDIKGKKV